MSLLIDDYIERNPDSIVTIVHDRTGVSLTGIMSDPQLIQTISASYGQGLKGSVSQAGAMLSGRGSGKMQKASNFLSSGLSMVGQFATSQHTLMGSVKVYEGSGDILQPFNITLFYDWNGNPGFKEVDRQLNILTQPKIYTGGLLGSNLYTPSELASLLSLNANVLKGKLPYVSLGSWYLAKDVYVQNINKNYSTTLNEEGKPLFVQLSFQIQPYKQLSAEELNSWIIA